MNVNVGPTAVLVLGLVLVVVGVSVAMEARSTAEMIGGLLPGVVVTIVALVMIWLQRNAKPDSRLAEEKREARRASRRAASRPTGLVGYLCLECGADLRAPVDRVGETATCSQCAASHTIPIDAKPVGLRGANPS
jgi:hypothetical protein